MTETTAAIERTIIVNFHPTFLSMVHMYPDSEEEYIHVIMSTNGFKTLPLLQRTHAVFSCLERDNFDILSRVPVYVETFTTEQIGDLIEYYL